MKTLRFVGTTLEDLRKFPLEARRHTGFQLDAVQRGLMPDDFKPMPTVGAGAYESAFMSRESGEYFTSRSSATQSMCFTRSKRRPKKRDTKVLNWRLAAIG